MTEHDERYVAGHDAGYVKGRDDGINIGYTDAKLRVALALDAVEAAKGKDVRMPDVREAVTDLLGKRS